MSDTTTAEDRCRGVLIGLAAGDKIGGPISMAVRLAESLVACGGFNAYDILERYLAWWREGAFDTGPVSDRALALLAAGMPAQEYTSILAAMSRGLRSVERPALKFAAGR
jgi:ADP-ribosylglycohydrolase